MLVRLISAACLFLAVSPLSIFTSACAANDGPASLELSAWTEAAPRDEMKPDFSTTRSGGRSRKGSLVIKSDDKPGRMGFWSQTVSVTGGQYYRFVAYRKNEGVGIPRLATTVRINWLDEKGRLAFRDQPVVGPYHPAGQPDRSTGEFPADQQTDEHGWTEVSGVFRTPPTAIKAVVELHLDWAPSATVEWSDVSLTKTTAPPSRIVRLATIHYVPTGKVSPADNCRQFASFIEEAARQRADLVVLPETLTHTGTGLTYAEASESIPGPSTEYFSLLARQHRLHLVVGLLERVDLAVYNVAILIDPDGKIIGKYRKVCLPRTEVEMGITPGTEYPVFETRFGKVGMMICYDGFFPEVARELSNNGAEVIAFPVAGCNPKLVAARACENHVYVVSSTYCGVALNWMISGIFGHQGEVLAQATDWGSVAVAEVDLNRPTIWANIGDYKAQSFRHRPATAAEQIAVALGQQEQGKTPQKAAIPNPAAVNIAAAQQSKNESSASPNPLNNLRIPPREPDDAQSTFKTVDGFRLDLLAAEPLTTDPVAMEYDENGRAYVVEMTDYPYTDKTKDKPFTEKTADLPIGKVRLLEDTDGDGKFDRSTIFAEDLSWPTGLAIWKGGIYVTATPDLWYFKDTDGDGKADIRRKVFTGFHKFNVQAVVNNLRMGLDHRIYGAGGTNGGSIVRVADGAAKPRKMASNDFWFDPLQEEFELISGGARFGHSFDDWGNRFTCNIRNPIRHAVIDDKYLTRNPLLPVASPLHDAAEAGDTLAVYRTSPPEPWRVINARRLASDPTGISPRSESVAAGYVTSTCGITVYRGSAYPPSYYGTVFLGEVAANLIHRQRLVPESLTFRAERMDDRVEFLTSTDNWFRPVNFVNAPDGTLHVLDMYRETIEHPWSIPDDIKAHLDLESGRDRGRIYRLTPPNFQSISTPRLGSATTADLVRHLNHPNSWWRETAHRLIYERQDATAIPLLREALQQLALQPGMAIDGVGRLGALWSLHGLNGLTDDDLLTALADPVAGVRENTIKLAEDRIPSSARLSDAVLQLANDSNVRVRCRAAFVAGGLTNDAAIEALAKVAQQDPNDPWVRTAVVSAAPDVSARVLSRLLSSSTPDAPAPLITIRTLAMIVGARQYDAETASVLKAASNPASTKQDGNHSLIRREIILGLSEGIARHQQTLAEVIRRTEPAASTWVDELMKQARELSENPNASVDERVQAIRLISQGSVDSLQPMLFDRLDPHEPREVQQAAIQALSRSKDPELATKLLGLYRGLTPGVRGDVMHFLLSNNTSIGAVLAAIDERRLSIGDIPFGRRAILLRNSDETLRKRAQAIFSREALGSRREVVEQYQAALQRPADPLRGQQVSQRICQNCHRFNGQGHDVGPALETIRHRSPGEVLLHVLDPNREVSPNFLEYVITLKSGKTTTGVIAAETPTSVTVRRAEGASETILRSDIEELSSTGKSIMPEGLEKQISIQEMADLLSFLLGVRS